VRAAITAALAAALLLACGHLLRPAASQPTPEDAAPCACPDADATLVEVMVERDACHAELATAAVAEPAPQPRVRVVERQGPPKRCAGDGPEIVPIESTTCAKGMTCLDERNEARLARNLVAYAAWVQRVQDCEAGR
jgi:hypothetical protein